MSGRNSKVRFSRVIMAERRVAPEMSEGISPHLAQTCNLEPPRPREGTGRASTSHMAGTVIVMLLRLLTVLLPVITSELANPWCACGVWPRVDQVQPLPATCQYAPAGRLNKSSSRVHRAPARPTATRRWATVGVSTLCDTGAHSHAFDWARWKQAHMVACVVHWQDGRPLVRQSQKRQMLL